VPLSVIVNIGPGLPNKCDVHQIARRFSWGLTPPNTSTYSKSSRSPLQEAGSSINKQVPRDTENDDPFTNNEGPLIRFQDKIQQSPAPSSDAKKQAVARSNTFGSVYNRGVKEKLRRAESEIERDIKIKMENVRPGSSALYYRLALDQAPRGTAQNDSSALGVTLDATDKYLSKPMVKESIIEIERRISDPEISIR